MNFFKHNHHQFDFDYSISSISSSASSSSPSLMTSEISYRTVYPGRCGCGCPRSHLSSPRLDFVSRIRRHMRRSSGKFADNLALQEERQLAEEIKLCKNYVKDLQTSYNMLHHKNSRGGDESVGNSRRSLSHKFRLGAREEQQPVGTLSEEMRIFEEEFKCSPFEQCSGMPEYGSSLMSSLQQQRTNPAA